MKSPDSLLFVDFREALVAGDWCINPLNIWTSMPLLTVKT